MARFLFRAVIVTALVLVCLDLSERVCDVLRQAKVLTHSTIDPARNTGEIVAITFALVVGWVMTRRDDAVTRCERTVARFNQHDA
jgi:hypothetical protein